MPEIYTDQLLRRLYANDASMYEELPEGVCFPETADDLRALVLDAAARGYSITARAAGTSLAGQTTGGGIIADTSRHMRRILEIDPDRKTATAEPGVIRDSLNREAAKYGLKFGPDTSTTNRCMLGGMIGNNSAGLYSLKYGSVREHIIRVEAVLDDGSLVSFGPLSDEELEAKTRLQTREGHIYREMLRLLESNKEAIIQNYPHPKVVRRNTGYALDRLCEMSPLTPGGRPFNLAELLCGSEGTLALMHAATVRLVEAEPCRVLLIPHFSTLSEAMHATVLAVSHKPAAVELIDDIIIRATEGNIEQQRNRFFLAGDPKCLLIIEFEGHDTEVLLQQAANCAAALQDSGYGYAFPLYADPEKMRRVWDLRKAGLGLLMGLGADASTPTFTEDTAVRVQDLPAYVADFEAMMQRYGTSCVYYAHASVGELHLRPAIDITKAEGVEKMKRMAEDVALLVKKYRGSLSGEHGDGRARAPYIELVLGKEMMPLLEEVKRIWDPENRFNPGKIVQAKPIDSQLRLSFGRALPEAETVFRWQKEGGFAQALQLCNGAGVCRKRAESGGTMCPSYMATLDEKDSTRGRANVFRQLFMAKGTDAFSSAEIRDALRYCLSCKACKSECPANVDMARMKAEFMQGWYDQNGADFAARFWADPHPWLRLGARFPRLSNAIAGSSAGHFVMEKLAGLHPERPLPAFAEKTFGSWVKEHFHRYRRTGQKPDRPPVLLLVDPFTDLHEPEQAIAAVEVLHAAGAQLMLPLIASCGRTQISSGFPREAQRVLRELLRKLEGPVQRGALVVGLEPSELLTLRDELPDLLPAGDPLAATAAALQKQAMLFEEFMTDKFSENEFSRLFNGKDRPVLVHGHCYVKALTGTAALMRCLKQAGYVPSETDSGCCGMAGSFGYRTDTFALSQQIGAQRLFPAVNAVQGKGLICAHGFSCRHQIADGTGRQSLHPAVLLRLALR
ncbi:MAG: FAD-binding protein [Candidatus Cyclonatronum sp.]|uniref:FAD-binding and (Fe-S)-binding domain-containing protein n=1 Tax=Cyclonatronum sp. TaxID=3024185 RepID=UPI0025C53B96|nr:FAD-binding and (Fe-S)-binding domain-containing protein [Cyclonatronum sp.]MCH8486398.1 FAD-binding protein [Cyclonatronum sp.]